LISKQYIFEHVNQEFHFLLLIALYLF
jgi:hypothetical protein